MREMSIQNTIEAIDRATADEERLANEGRSDGIENARKGNPGRRFNCGRGPRTER
jgi:hypothetical protein